MSDYSTIRDANGKLIGTTRSNGSTGLTYDANGKTVARVTDNRTFDANGKYVGTGDQSLLKLKK